MLPLMYVGHYAAAIGLVALTPQPAGLAITVPVALGVAWPDLVWPVLVRAGVERVRVDPDDPLQRAQRFTHYPYSHSLVLSALVTAVPALIIALIAGPLGGLLFWAGALTHWLLDLVVHLRDLPVLGFGRDRTVGWGLWRAPRTAFLVEYALLAAAALLWAPRAVWPGLLIGGAVLHLLNANSFFGLTRANPLNTPAKFAAVAGLGYLGAIAWFVLTWR